MAETERITKEKLLHKMEEFSDIYDVVRLVEPESSSVVNFGPKGMQKMQKEPCFSVWEKNEKCNNCISLRACVENRKITKFEFRDNEIYSVLAVPYIVIDEKHVYRLSLELVKHIGNDLMLESDGKSPQAREILELNRKIYEDSLTGAFNRRYYDEYRYIFEMSHSMPKKIGFLLVDINDFKHINDQYGHMRGDEVLAKVADTLKFNVRTTDRVMRVGGDEFLIVLRDCNEHFLQKKIYQIKRAVTKIKFPWLIDVCPSVSVGMAYTDDFSGNHEQLKKLYDIADNAMYEDKKIPAAHVDKKIVLVVDDIEMNRSMIKKQLGIHYSVYEAENGVEALELLKKYQFDLIITDIFMDKMNGYEFMAKVKSISAFRDIPIIAVTENNESSQKEAIESGADIYIDRPSGQFLSGIAAKMTGRDHGRKELFNMDFLLDTIPGAVVVYKISKEGKMRIVSCSRGVNQLSGWESDEFCEADTDTNVAAIFPADLEKFNSTIQRMVRTHSRGEVIYRGYRKDGSMVWIWFQGRYIGEEDGCAVVEAILLDVSNNTNMYQNILDESLSAITVVDAHTFEVLYANKRADALVNVNHEAYLGSTCYNFVFHRDKPCAHCLANHRQQDCYQTEFEWGGKTYQQNFSRIMWHGIEAFLEYTTDVTAEHKLFVAEKVAETKSGFYSRMSHDMRTPMNGILGITELAKEETDVIHLHSDLDKIEESGKYMLNLINDTLDYQRLESNRLELKEEVVFADDFLKNLMSMLQIAAKAKKVNLISDYGKIDSKWFVKIDEMRMKQVLVNIISNAIKFTPEGGNVKFSIVRLGIDGMVCHEKITVSDTGIGMSGKFIENGLFKPFSQEVNEVTMKYAGSGLGLSIVNSLVQLMNGRIEVESELGTGTTFTIYVDIERVSKEELEMHNKENEASKNITLDLSGHTILLCEDHPLNAEIVQRMLKHVNANVVWAKDGEEGVEKFRKADSGYFSAILMDIRMPKMDGLEATKKIRKLGRKDSKTVPIIAMSANAYDEDIKKSLDAGMNEHLAKPVEKYILYETLNNLLKK